MKKNSVLRKESFYYLGIVTVFVLCVSLSRAEELMSFDSGDTDPGRQQVQLCSSISPEEEDFFSDDTGEIEKEPVSVRASSRHMVEQAGIFMLEKCLQFRTFVKEKSMFCKQCLYNMYKSLKNMA